MRTTQLTPLRPNMVTYVCRRFLLWLMISCSAVHVTDSNGNWCSHTVTRREPCKVPVQWNTVGQGYGGQYVTAYKYVTRLVWECCPGFSGPSCTTECLNCSTIQLLQSQVEKLQRKVSNLWADKRGSTSGGTNTGPDLEREILNGVPGADTGRRDRDPSPPQRSTGPSTGRSNLGPSPPQRSTGADSPANLARERGDLYDRGDGLNTCPRGCIGPIGPQGPPGPPGLPGHISSPMHPVGSSYRYSQTNPDTRALLKRLESLERKVTSLTSEAEQNKINLRKLELLTARVRILEELLPLFSEAAAGNCSEALGAGMSSIAERCGLRLPPVTSPPPFPPRIQADMPEIYNNLAFVVSRVIRGKFAPDRKMHKINPQTPMSDELDETKLGRQFEADVAYPAARRFKAADAVPYVEKSVVNGGRRTLPGSVTLAVLVVLSIVRVSLL